MDFFLSPISKPVVIDNIFYDFDKATLRPESKKALDEMIKMLNDNPNVTIELVPTRTGKVRTSITSVWLNAVRNRSWIT